MAELFDVFAVNIKTGDRRVLERNLTSENAEAVIRFAVIRRGVDVEFYIKQPAAEIAQRETPR